MKERFAIKIFLYWRLWLFLPLLFGPLLLSIREGYRLAPQLMYSYANFDGVKYLAIAQRGYITEGAFFPLYPLLIKFFSNWSSNMTTLFWAGLLLSNICIVTGLIFLNKLLLLDYPKGISRETVLLMLVFPTAFFFGTVYSESLFLLSLVLSFYLARKRKWLLACLIAMLLSVTRLVGIFILPVLIWEYARQAEGKKIKDFLYFAVVPLGFLGYAWFNLKKWGDAFYFIHAHGQLANSRSVDKIILFPQTIFRYFKILFSLPVTQYEWWIALLELSIFVFGLVFLYVAWRRKVRLSYLIFSALAFFLPASSGTFSGFPRYVLVLFPIFIALALSKSKLLKIAYVVIGIILQFLLLMFFSRGYFVS